MDKMLATVKSRSVNSTVTIPPAGFQKIGLLLLEQKVANSLVSFQDLKTITDN